MLRIIFHSYVCKLLLCRYPTTISEQYGIPYLNAAGIVEDSYCGSTTILHEFFHTIQDLVISPHDPLNKLQVTPLTSYR